MAPPSASVVFAFEDAAASGVAPSAVATLAVFAAYVS